MSKKYRKCFKKAVSYMLMVVLCINMVFYSLASTESEIRPNEITTEHGTLEITSDSIIIDGNAYSKAQFTQALQQLKQLPTQQNPPQSNVRSGVDVVIHFLGIGLNGVFAKIAFSIAMAGLLDLVRNITYVLFTDVLPGLSRMVEVEIKDSTSIYFDGVRVGANWVTTEIATYLSENHASIEEVAEGDDEAAIEEAVNSISEQKKQHILQDKHYWNRLVPNPNDPNNWQKVAAFISLTLSEGKEEPYGSAFQKVLIWGEEMIVVTYQYVDSILRISDAWVVK